MSTRVREYLFQYPPRIFLPCQNFSRIAIGIAAVLVSPEVINQE